MWVALSRGFLLSGRGLDNIAEAVLDINVNKLSQKSNWDQLPLPHYLQKYAAKDALCSLLLYEHLNSIPDLTLPPKPKDMKPGMTVDIAPYLGKINIFNKGCRAASGTIVEKSQSWNVPTHLSTKAEIAHG